MNLYDVIRKPRLTEKSVAAQGAHNQYTFVVDRRATKYQIRQAIEQLFKVNVIALQTSRMPGKWKRVGKNVGKLADQKKAIATLQDGQRIEFVEGV
ncbi:MAG: 50S ribosomal protein L23 [Deltaproteobacteria bacterium RIFCSPLOWO2_02_FULL_44_10]|nr:MAG: 50S ribosomal protein L23 [Deltaproteobacteria bacterium RIFCSPHIGHO2_02_FULL_44_16]OGQ45586.1 MAG: 50S ribosomal protein L23 [Deltaproteobacteria bacterium RIFCSPLOWO2_02_FULL_44_10]